MFSLTLTPARHRGNALHNLLIVNKTLRGVIREGREGWCSTSTRKIAENKRALRMYIADLKAAKPLPLP
jgi:hypothetical protein